MPNETFEDARPGDRPSASQWNKLTELAEALDGDGPPYGQQGVNLEGVRGTAQHGSDLTVVRVLATVVPESSTQYLDALTYQVGADGTTGADADNAVVQVWDEEAQAWADDPSGETLTVAVPDDQPGWAPLVAGDIVPVHWKKTAQRWVPLEARETAVVQVTGGTQDADGMYTGVMMAYNSDTRQWFVRGTCYVIDTGSGPSPSASTGATSGFSGTVP